MLFNSIPFLVFFPVVFFLYWALPGKVRPFLLLLASCYFYMAFVPYYILVLFFLITVDYVLAFYIERGGAYKKLYLYVAILSNVGLLFVFKYFNFFDDNITALAQTLHWNYSLGALSLILPLGLSFHIFQSLAYIIEVYKGRYNPERNYLTYALYVMFFPQLVAGPIERPAQLLPQLKTTQQFRYSQVVSGLRLMMWGFFKKIVIANNLAILVTFVYARSGTADASVLLVAVFAFSIQLYADFSGYSDIAVGSARMLGIELVQNFKQPYFSRSIAEFWRRWHISLSSWFRDYVYLPLAWKYSARPWGLYGAVVFTFVLTGVWHGAGWNYAAMGLLFGLYICVGMWTKNWRDSVAKKIGLGEGLRAIFQIGTTFILTTFAWIFFRSANLQEALMIIRRLLTEWGSDAFHFLLCGDYCSFYMLGVGKKTLLMIGLSVAILFIVEYVQQSATTPRLWQYRAVRWGSYYLLLVWTLLIGYFAPTIFIYFQF